MEATMAEARMGHKLEDYPSYGNCNSHKKVDQISDEKIDSTESRPIYGSNFDDSIYLSFTKTKAYGCMGDDVLRASGNENELYGGEGNDELFGNGEDYILNGGNGNDKLYLCNKGEAYGGEGDDIYYYGHRNCARAHLGMNTRVQIRDAGGEDKLVIKGASFVMGQHYFAQEEIAFGTSDNKADDNLYICVNSNRRIKQCDDKNAQIHIKDFFGENNGRSFDIYKVEEVFGEYGEGFNISYIEEDVTTAIRYMLENADIAEADRLIGLFPKFIDTYTLIYDTSGKEVGKENHLGHASRLCNETNAKLLLDNGADVNAKNDLGQSALHLSVNANCLKVIRLLVANNADLEIKDNYGRTPLQYSVLGGVSDMFSKLIESGAVYSEFQLDNLYITDLSRLHYALLVASPKCEEKNVYNNSLISTMVSSGDYTHSVDSLESTPLHYAVFFQCKQFAKQLILNGADVNAKDEDGNKPFDLHTDFKKICDSNGLEQPYKFACEKMNNPNNGNRITDDATCYPNKQVEEFFIAGESWRICGQEIHDEL
jgi:ankyrin repeat protein